MFVKQCQFLYLVHFYNKLASSHKSRGPDFLLLKSSSELPSYQSYFCKLVNKSIFFTWKKSQFNYHKYLGTPRDINLDESTLYSK